ELRCDGSSAFHVRRRARIERSEVGDTLPDRREPAQYCAVLLVERLVRLGAELEELAGVREAAALGDEVLILAGARRRLGDLVALERQQIDARQFLSFVEAQRLELRPQRAQALEGAGDLV